MKGLLFLLMLLFTGFFIVNNFTPELPIGEGLTEKVVRPARYASLLAAEPESKIEIPLRKLNKKQISDTWEAPRGNDRQHQGQDLFAPRNTPVYSATKGYIWRTGENKLGGNTVWVIGAGGRVYYYAHLEKYAENLQVGDEVSTDTILGYVGDSGNAKGTPTHLHFGVYTTGGAIKPLTLF